MEREVSREFSRENTVQDPVPGHSLSSNIARHLNEDFCKIILQQMSLLTVFAKAWERSFAQIFTRKYCTGSSTRAVIIE